MEAEMTARAGASCLSRRSGRAFSLRYPRAGRLAVPAVAGSSGQHQPSLGVLGGLGADTVPKVRSATMKAATTMAATSPET
jgi:hypothetical protein